MSYQTPAQFRIAAFPSGSFNELSDVEVQHALDVAQAEVDAALRPHHTLPLVEVDSSIIEAERVIASYRLMLFRGFKPETLDPSLSLRYQEVVGVGSVEPSASFLGRLSTGRFLLSRSADSTLKRERRARAWNTLPQRQAR